MIHPTRAQFPTTASEIARIAARHIQAAEQLVQVKETKVFCTNPNDGPGFRHWSVTFLEIKPSFNEFTGKPVEQHSLETYNGRDWDKYTFIV